MQITLLQYFKGGRALIILRGGDSSELFRRVIIFRRSKLLTCFSGEMLHEEILSFYSFIQYFKGGSAITILRGGRFIRITQENHNFKGVAMPIVIIIVMIILKINYLARHNY